MHVRDGGLEDLDGMARVWAAATDARDGRATPASFADAREPLLAAITDQGAITVVVEEERQVVAFAVATTGSPPGDGEAEVRFVGVAPSRWRNGLGERVMAALVSRLRRQGYDGARLLVYVDNLAAIALYERCGWAASSEPPSVHPRSGRRNGATACSSQRPRRSEAAQGPGARGTKQRGARARPAERRGARCVATDEPVEASPLNRSGVDSNAP